MNLLCRADPPSSSSTCHCSASAAGFVFDLSFFSFLSFTTGAAFFAVFAFFLGSSSEDESDDESEEEEDEEDEEDEEELESEELSSTLRFLDGLGSSTEVSEESDSDSDSSGVTTLFFLAFFGLSFDVVLSFPLPLSLVPMTSTAKISSFAAAPSDDEEESSLVGLLSLAWRTVSNNGTFRVHNVCS